MTALDRDMGDRRHTDGVRNELAQVRERILLMGRASKR